MSPRARSAGIGLLLLVMLLVGVQSAAAQTCRGLPAIGENSKGNIGGRVGFARSALALDANFTYGTNFVVGGFQFGKQNYTDFAYTSTIIGFNIGGQFGFGEEKRFSVCPAFNFVDESASNLNALALSETIDISTGGASFGFIINAGERRQIIPTIELSAGRLRDSLQIPGTLVSERSNVGIVTIGIGFGFDKRVSVRPAFTHQIGGAHPTETVPFAGRSYTGFSVLATVAYGRR